MSQIDKRLSEALVYLTKEYREVILFVDILGYSIEHAGRVLQISTSEIELRLVKARDQTKLFIVSEEVG
jgi:DNA-directed RNA polymerase specialized sigma24 family protein